MAMVLGIVILSLAAVCASAAPHIVLVHGAASGAWIWFKIIPGLEKAGFKATAVDLAGGGINLQKARNFDEYTKPFQDYMANLNHKVMLVGHSAGGLSIALASENFPNKVKVAVYVAAPMRPSDFALLPKNNNLVNTSDGYRFTKKASRRAHQLCSIEDITLAGILDRPFPSLATNFTTTQKRYGSVPRVYIKTLQDRAIEPEIQSKWIAANPPKKAFNINSDHIPLHSRAPQLIKLLVQIAKSYA